MIMQYASFCCNMIEAFEWGEVRYRSQLDSAAGLGAPHALALGAAECTACPMTRQRLHFCTCPAITALVTVPVSAGIELIFFPVAAVFWI